MRAHATQLSKACLDALHGASKGAAPPPAPTP
jgi:hypothetical protein